MALWLPVMGGCWSWAADGGPAAALYRDGSLYTALGSALTLFDAGPEGGLLRFSFSSLATLFAGCGWVGGQGWWEGGFCCVPQWEGVALHCGGLQRGFGWEGGQQWWETWFCCVPRWNRGTLCCRVGG